ncbi:MAG: polysaccharide biosynthesis tyrosine autokinase [Actinomycetota bacterium]|nr:polysaccharide biosynthesis tyrosine autokinase [Actinomycetota bacterium]
MSSVNDGMKEGRQLQRPPEYPVPMAAVQPQGEINIRDYLYVLYRRRWLALTFFTLVVFTVLLVVFLKKPVYRATATLKVEQETSPVLNFKDVYQTQKDDFNFLKTQYRILKSRSVAKRAVRSLRLDGDPEFAGAFSRESADAGSQTGGMPVPGTGKIELSGGLGGDIKPSVIDNFLKRLTVTPVRDSWIVLVSFDDKNPARAAQAVNEIARQYIGFNIESKLNASQVTRDWLENHLDDMKAKLERSEEALNKYAAQNGILLASAGDQDKNNPNGSGGQDLETSRLVQISDQLVKATADRINKEALYYQVRHGGPVGSEVGNNRLLQTLEEQYSALEAQYARLAALYTPKYPEVVQTKEQMDQLSKRIGQETDKAVAALRTDYEAARQREDDLAQTYEQYKQQALNLNNKMVQYNILKREADTNQQLYNGLLQRMKEIGVSASLNASNIQVLDQAEVPRKPFAPKKARDILVSVLVGLLGGVGLAFGVDYIDNTLKNPEDIENSISLPCLGLVPAIETVPAGKRLLAWSEEEHAPILLEAYSAINTFIQFSSGSQAPKLMMVTSPLKGDGKTMTSVNLAATMARTRGRGLIVDSDLRNPQLHKIFDVDNTRGFSDYLAGMMQVEDGLVRKSGLENLDIITSGPRSPNPPDLFNSPRLADLLRKLGPEYEFILFDSPPVIGFSESLILSTSVDGVIMVVRTGRTTREAALQSRRAIESINSRVLGVVLNAIRQVDLKYSSYYHYGDYYYYSDGEKKAGRKKQKAKNAIEN